MMLTIVMLACGIYHNVMIASAQSCPDHVTVEDQFDAVQLNDALWTPVVANGATLTQEDGVLKALTANQVGSRTSLESTFLLSGDFDVRVNLELIDFNINWLNATLLVMDESNKNNYVAMSSVVGAMNQTYYHSSINGRVIGSVTAHVTQSLTLRITREGALFKTYYWADSAWVENGVIKIFNGPTKVLLVTTNAGVSPASEVHWDHFQALSLHSEDCTAEEQVVDTVGPTITDVTLSSVVVCEDTTMTAMATDDLSLIATAEYYIDTDPGVGEGVALDVSDGSYDSSRESLSILFSPAVLNALSSGVHVISIRAQDEVGNWGAVVSTAFVVDRQAVTVIARGFTPEVVNTSYAEGVDDARYHFSLSGCAVINIHIYDAEGVLVKTTLSDMKLQGGNYTYTWNGTNNDENLVEDGLYYYTISGVDHLGNMLGDVRSQSSIVNSPSVRIRNHKIAIGQITVTPASFDPDMETVSIETTLYAHKDKEYNVTTQVRDVTGVLVYTHEEQVTHFTSYSDGSYRGYQSSYQLTWDGIATQGTGEGQRVPNGDYQVNLSLQRIDHKGKSVGGLNGVANIKSATVVVTSTKYIESRDGVMSIYYPDVENVTIIESPEVPMDAIMSLYGRHQNGVHLVSALYEITQEYGVNMTASLLMKHDNNLSGDAVNIIRYNPALQVWEAMDSQIVDSARHTVHTTVSEFSGVYAMVSSRDIMAPLIKELMIVPGTVTFAVEDDLSGVNVDSLKLYVDGQNVTAQTVFSGVNGSSRVTAECALYYDTAMQHTIKVIASDMALNRNVTENVFQGGLISATVMLKHKQMNAKSDIIIYVAFPEGYHVQSITEARLDGASAEEMKYRHSGLPRKGITSPVMEMTFRKKEIIKALSQTGETIDHVFVLTGMFNESQSGLSMTFSGVATAMESQNK